MRHPALRATGHRPWPLPKGRWALAQTWSDLLFAHWPIHPEALQELIPDAFEIDTYDGTGWVGIVPFRMSGVRRRFLPALPWLSRFPELNVRTYVRPRGAGNEKPGVWFFSLEAASRLAVYFARKFFHLPYFRADMGAARDGELVAYSSRRTHAGAPPALFASVYGPTAPPAPAEPGSLPHWLTERYALYTADDKGRPCIGEIHHAPWPLQEARAVLGANTMADASSIELPDADPVLHFARRLDVVVWPLRRLQP